MNDKLKVLVKVDLECASAHIEVMGQVSAGNVQALSNLANRANSIHPGLHVVLDLGRSSVTPEALEQLTLSAASRLVPAPSDLMQADCCMEIVPPTDVMHHSAASQAA